MYTVPDLPYSYDALEPAISREIMELHHDKHHRAYVDKLNKAIEAEPSLKDESLVEMLTSLEGIPEAVRNAVRNQGGGHYNHSLFWTIMSPDGGGEPSGELAEKLAEKYGNFNEFVKQFNEKAAALFGSGWVWLTKDLETIALPNQDTPMNLGMGEPLMGLDVWEHAYYLDYKNKRDEYIEKWWSVVNWREIEKRYEQYS